MLNLRHDKGSKSKKIGANKYCPRYSWGSYSASRLLLQWPIFLVLTLGLILFFSILDDYLTEWILTHFNSNILLPSREKFEENPI